MDSLNYKEGHPDYDASRQLCEGCVKNGKVILRKKGKLIDGNEDSACMGIIFPQEYVAEHIEELEKIAKGFCDDAGKLGDFARVEDNSFSGWYIKCDKKLE